MTDNKIYLYFVVYKFRLFKECSQTDFIQFTSAFIFYNFYY